MQTAFGRARALWRRGIRRDSAADRQRGRTESSGSHSQRDRGITPATHPNSSIKKIVSISVGVGSIIPKRKSNPNLLVALADEALYLSKQLGRDQVTVKEI